MEKSRTSEVNVWHRLYYSRDAWQLVRQRPLTGWGGGGWQDAYRQQQSYLYHSKRVHNQYAEVAVETGLPGLLVYLGVWGLFILRAGQLYSRSRGEEKNVAGAALGYLLFFALHTTIDFDFSYLAVMSTVWAVGGAVSRQVQAWERDDRGQIDTDKVCFFGQDTREGARPPSAPGRLVYQGGLAFLLLPVLVGSLWLGTAEWYYQGAVRRYMAGEQKAAQKMILSAIAMYPLHSDYYQLASKLAIAGGGTTAALRWARKAQEVAPRSVLAIEQIVQAARPTGQVDVAVAAARCYSQFFRCDIAGRNRLARLQLDAAVQSLQQGDKQRARQYVDDCRATLEQTASFWEQVPEKYRKM
ncbi:MAG: O-antigen ligase family protein [Desulfurispora sp.]|uniref:O-antigen ligase family protein n=1 Tax=Desulfurispora sp. TaxID=3014275 RepID=UPI00404B09DB